MRAAVSLGMAIVLISWIGVSVVLCVAFLGAAACPTPRIDEEVIPGAETAAQWEAAGASRNPSLASRPSPSAVASSCRAA